MTTSPRSVLRLTRDTCNNPLWNSGVWAEGGAEEEGESTGRLGRFNRRFDLGTEDGADWMNAQEGPANEEAKRLAAEAANRMRGPATHGRKK